MSHLVKPETELGRDYDNKPDFRELDLGSPVSPLRTGQQGLTMTTTTTTTTTTSSSSSSSRSVSGRNSSNATARRSESGRNNHSGELSGSSETSPTASTGNMKPAQTRSKPNTATTHPLIYSGQSTVNSPAVNVLPTGNICPSGRIIKTGMAVNRSSRTDVLGSGSGNYGHGSIMRAGGVGTGPVTPSRGTAFEPSHTLGNRGNASDVMRKAMGNLEPEELKKVGNEMYKKGHFLEALSLYDKAIALSPANAAYRSNRAAALTALGRVGEAVKECEEAVRLDPNYGRAHQRLASLLLR